jgi:hypothetical protein
VHGLSPHRWRQFKLSNDPEFVKKLREVVARAWLARQPRWTFHFIPTSSSWLNAVKGFFAKLTRRRLKHGVFKSVDELKGAIDRFIAEHNETEARPFIWRADPDEIIAARKRGFQTLESIHQMKERLWRTGLSR